MKVLLLAAGLGVRLRPLTDTVPKCLVPIGGKPLLEIWLDSLVEAGLGPILINTHYLETQVERFVEKSRHRDQVVLVSEPVLLGTAGTLRANLNFFENRGGLLIHADNYCLADINDFLAAHQRRPSSCLMSMMVFRTDQPSLCGIVEHDDQKVVVNFHEKVSRPPNNLANGAVYIFSPEFVKELSTPAYESIADFSTEVIPRFLGRIYAHEISELFLDIGTPINYEYANRLSITSVRLNSE